ncbi:unnamed protein product [Calicophoron daubneyi]|uniref:RNA polymerase II-associated protein 3 n=1 Tax=Calicophoron daubneyi TaxID=300641 RepID=A0AAV2THE1_CALDB
MDPEKFIQLQKQMRENNEEVADFLKDFGSWKKSVENKEAKLQGKSEASDDLPAIRNSLLQKKKKKHKLNDPGAPKVSERIRGSDYRAWDQFDIDKALKDVDEKSDVEEEASSETDEELENQRRLALSKESRELGNVRFKEGKFMESVEQYTTSIRLTPEDPVPYTNRAFAYLRLERYSSAEADCSAALALNPNCPKALFRRALARKNLAKSSEAIADLEILLQSNPSNKAALKEYLALTGHSFVDKSKIKSAETQDSSMNRVSIRGSRRMRRIPIVEVGSSGDQRLQASGPSSTVPLINGPVSSAGDIVDTSVTPTTRIQTDESAIAAGEDSRITTKDNVPTYQYNPHPVSPANWFQLERWLRELNKGGGTVLSAAAVNYLWSLQPEQYVEVIGNNLDTNFLAQMLHAFQLTDVEDLSDLANRLNELSKLPRFDVAWMMIDDSERVIFKDLFARLTGDTNLPPDVINRIREQFS